MLKVVLKHSAAAIGTVVAAVLLVGSAFRLQSRETRGKAMIKAFWSGHNREGQLLISLGADPNFLTNNASAMHVAAGRGDMELMRFLIEHGAAVDQPVKWDVRPIDWARRYQQTEAVHFLIAHGADGNHVPQTPP
ncbi:MAG TPA: ankyrin repeat domain-containing protein [Chthoniobacterales bacterium]|nr:ankyrin repeat domain-containing protein [Chthoniobacterales bacterium]